MKQYLCKHASKHIAVAFLCCCSLDSLGDSASQASCCSRELLQDSPSDVGCVGWRRGDLCSVSPHNLAAERLLLVGNLDHVDLAVQTEVCTCHGKGCSPLSGASLGGHTLEALFLCIVGLGDGGVKLVASGCVVSLKLIINFCRGSQLFLKAVCPYQRGWPVHLVEVPDFLWNLDIWSGVIQLLLCQLLAENRGKLLQLKRLMCARVEQRCRLVLHISTEIVPALWQLTF